MAPKAKLVLKDTTPILARKTYLAERLQRHDFPLNRVEIRLGTINFLSELGEIDLMLDTYPYPGGAMTCTALYAGIPVVARKGERYSSRLADSILTAADKSAWLAPDREAYEVLAAQMLKDREQLAYWRENLRRELEASSLMNKTIYMAGVEAAYRQAAECIPSA